MFYIDVFKAKNGKIYSALKCDLGYTCKILSWDCALLAEIAGLSVRELLSECRRINL